jgi:quinolinate synthase
MKTSIVTQQIKALKDDRQAIILAHYYQVPEIQDVADYVGDSFALSKLAAELPNEMIVFCGVDFMAESAKLLSPHKTVLLPVKDAGCPMADMATAAQVKKLKAAHPGAAVVSYVNSTTEVKAHSDVCVTSGNALKVIRALPEKKIIFLPDENLGSWAAEQIPEKEFILFNGYCPPHEEVMAVDVILIRKQHPGAMLLVHPECRKEVRDLADFIGSTAQIIRCAAESKHDRFIIGTEEGILHPLRRNHPEKQFSLLSPGLFCPNMKKTRPEHLLYSLQNLTYAVEIDKALAEAARRPLSRMLELS